jgi:hypothetical protein
VLAELGDAAQGIGRDVRILLQRVENRRLLDDGVLAQQQHFLQVGVEKTRHLGEQNPRHVAAAENGLQHQRVLPAVREVGEHRLAGILPQKRHQELGVEAAQGLSGALRDILGAAAGKLDLQRDRDPRSAAAAGPRRRAFSPGWRPRAPVAPADAAGRSTGRPGQGCADARSRRSSLSEPSGPVTNASGRPFSSACTPRALDRLSTISLPRLELQRFTLHPQLGKRGLPADLHLDQLSAPKSRYAQRLRRRPPARGLAGAARRGARSGGRRGGSDRE